MVSKPFVIEFPFNLRGRFVAYCIVGGRVKIIDIDNDFGHLLRKLKRKGVDVRFVQVDYIPEEDVVYLI
jgi:DNA-binding sugar fermentation-stimulating protein